MCILPAVGPHDCVLQGRAMSQKRWVVELSVEEREQLSKLVRRGKPRAARWKRLRARILLKVDEGPAGPAWPDATVASSLDVSVMAVRNARKRLVEHGLAGALTRKRREAPPRPPKLDGAGQSRLIALACGAPPKGRVRWTLTLLADALVALEVVDSISRETVRQGLKKTTSNLTSEQCG